VRLLRSTAGRLAIVGVAAVGHSWTVFVLVWT